MQPGRKFFIGVVLIITNFIVGKIAVPLFAVEVVLGAIIYLFSWLMLLVGLFLCGREGLSYAGLHYRHFERKIKRKALKRFSHKPTPQVSDDNSTPMN